MKHPQRDHAELWRALGGAGSFILFFLCTFIAHAQTTIDLSVMSNGGSLQDGPPVTLYSTIGEPFSSDSASAASGETTWIGFWQVLPVGIPSGVSEEQFPGIGGATRVDAVYPNPFSSDVAVDLRIGHSGRVILSVYDMLGREVGRLLDGRREEGTIHLNWHPDRLDAGNYFLRLKIDGVEYPAFPIQYYR
jgi:hypothetical protein